MHIDSESSRRWFIADLLVGSVAGPLALLPCWAESGKASYSDLDAADKWLRPLVYSPGASSNSLHLGRFADRIYYLDKEILWEPNPGQERFPSVKVPAGFVTDLASIPRIFWSLLPTDGQYTFPAIVHDFLYWEQKTSREAADNIFRLGMEDFKVASGTISAIFAAVRIGGQSAWERNAALKSKGERRYLEKFPDDPKTTWQAWAKIPGATR